MRRVARPAGLLVAVALLAGACMGGPATTPAAGSPPAPTTPLATAPAGREAIILATTTSTRDSGLLDVLVPAFEAPTGFNVKVIAVGSGQAMTMGAECNADVLLVHSPEAEEEFMVAGSGVDRRLVMHNDFVIVGPPADPAGIAGLASADALARIAAAQATFVSRGDTSGTHAMELGLWRDAGITPAPAWYLESGQGMAATLTIASEKDGYSLADRATYLAMRGGLALEILAEGDAALRNVYHVISVNPARCAVVNAIGATAWADFLVSPEAQAMIGAFGVEELGQPLFVPDAGTGDDELGS
jgi:tungstate transport system substrate-binding protein